MTDAIGPIVHDEHTPAASPSPLVDGGGSSVDKVLAIVEVLFLDGGALSAKDVAERTGINRTTAHRLLNALMHRGWVEKTADQPSYAMSLKFHLLAGLMIGRRDVVAELRPLLERLSLTCRESVHLGMLDGFEIVHVEKIDGPERFSVSSQVGSRAVPHVTALGKVLLAASPAEVVESYARHAGALAAPYTLTDRAAFERDLALTRHRGYSIDDEEDSVGVRCVGVAVYGIDGRVVFAVSVTGPSPRFTDERIAAVVPVLRQAAAEMTALLGGVAVREGSRR